MCKALYLICSTRKAFEQIGHLLYHGVVIACIVAGNTEDLGVIKSV